MSKKTFANLFSFVYWDIDELEEEIAKATKTLGEFITGGTLQDMNTRLSHRERIVALERELERKKRGISLP